MPKPKPRLFHLLILEDDLEVAGKLLLALHRVEPHLAPYDLDVTHLCTSEAVQALVNDHPERIYDVALMDRDCKLGQSFHTLTHQRVRHENIISISSTPMWNLQAQQDGIKFVEPKSFSDLDAFAVRVANKVLELLKASM